MSEDISNRNIVPDGVYNCTVTEAYRQEKHFGKDALLHVILTIGVRPTNYDNAEVFYAELPILFMPGEPWDFYDKNQKKYVTRNCTAKDASAAWAYAEKIFPAWKKFNDDESSCFNDSIAWFDNYCTGTEVRANLKNREYTDGSGNIAHNATLYAANSRSSIVEGLDARFEKSIAAAGIKIGKNRAKSGGPASLPAVKPASPSAKALPKKPVPPHAKPSKVYTSDDAWNAYEEHQKKVDPNGDMYWDRVGDIVGKDAADYESFTSADWEKCVKEFVGF